MMLLALDPSYTLRKSSSVASPSLGEELCSFSTKSRSQAMDDDEEEEADEKQNRSIFGVIPNTQFTQFSS